MPVPPTLHTSIFDIRCSKCKKLDDPGYCTQNGKVYKTCSECRDRARRRRAPRVRITQHDTDDVLGANAALSLSSSSAADPTSIPMDDYDRAILAAFSALGITASASASDSSAEYFVDEPMPEPEPESP